MKILALEFSSPMRGASVFAGNGVTGRACERGTREMKPFALIEVALREAGIGRDELDLIAVGLGPGSYAGIRIAMAIALGWNLARGTRLVGISSADCVAHQFNGEGRFSIMIDAQRNEFFVARYETAPRRDPTQRFSTKLIEPFHLMTEADRERQGAGEPFLRPDVLDHGPGWFALAPDSAQLAHLAAEMFFMPVEKHPLEPIYLRKAQFVKAPLPKFGGL